MTLIKGILVVVFAGLFLFIIGSVIFERPPDTTSLGFGTWNNDPDELSTSKSPQKTEISVKELVSIKNLKTRKAFYNQESNVTVDFIVKNPKELNYYLSVDWVVEGKKMFSWDSNSSKIEADFHAWYAPVNKLGKWNIQIVVGWIWNDRPYEASDTTEFEVIL